MGAWPHEGAGPEQGARSRGGLVGPEGAWPRWRRAGTCPAPGPGSGFGAETGAPRPPPPEPPGAPRFPPPPAPRGVATLHSISWATGRVPGTAVASSLRGANAGSGRSGFLLLVSGRGEKEKQQEQERAECSSSSAGRSGAAPAAPRPPLAGAPLGTMAPAGGVPAAPARPLGSGVAARPALRGAGGDQAVVVRPPWSVTGLPRSRGPSRGPLLGR